MKPPKPIKKKQTLSLPRKSKPKKADDFTVNTLTGKRTLSGAEATRMREQSLVGLKSGRVGTRNINDFGRYDINTKSTNLQVATGGKKNRNTAIVFKQGYLPAGTRTKRERGR